MKSLSLPLWIAMLVAGCAGDSSAPEQQVTTVIAQPPQMLQEQLQVEAVGSARAQTSADIYPETAGTITAVLFSPGDYVREGQPLVRLDSRREQLAVDLARVQVEEASQLLSRYRRIEDTGAISTSQIEAGETALASARVGLEQAQTALDYRTVRAPFSGHIGLTDLDVGDRVSTTTMIAQLDQRSTLFVDFPAPETAFSRLSTGQIVTVSPFSDPSRSIDARVIAVGSAIASDQRSYTVRVAIDNSSDTLRPGMSFRVNFTGRSAALPAVPEESIVWGGQGSYIWLVEDGKATRRPITISSRREGMALLSADLGADDVVIVEGVQKVREGQEVTLVRASQRSSREVALQPADTEQTEQ